MKVAICGAGNVGSALGNALIQHGQTDVLFYDVSETQLAKLAPMIKGRFDVSTDFNVLFARDVVFLCVPTEPIQPTGDADLTIITDVVKRLADGGFKGLIVQMSTCPPLTARNLSKLHGNYAVLPSYYTMGRMFYDAANPVRTLIGTADGKPNNILVELFSNFGGPMFFETFEAVELTKYVENTLSATLISFWNEVFLVSQRLNEQYGYSKVDSDRVARIVDVADCWRSVYRFHGRAYSGVCLPKDTKAYINWCINNVGYYPEVVSATDSVNDMMVMKFGKNEKHLVYRLSE